jgi:hypothetical protein
MLLNTGSDALMISAGFHGKQEMEKRHASVPLFHFLPKPHVAFSQGPAAF